MVEEIKRFLGYTEDGTGVIVEDPKYGIQTYPCEGKGCNRNLSVLVFNKYDGYQSVPIGQIKKYVPFVPEYD